MSSTLGEMRRCESGSQAGVVWRFVKRSLSALLALLLIVLGAPLFAGLALLVLVVDGRPVLHKGLRLGRHRRPFTMYKFRTLVRGASKVIGPELLTFRHKLTIPCGKFLRDSRLDELPQLFNILKGEMNFLGPRPERPEIYESFYRPIGNHDRLFARRPGLVGFSQLFTPHGTPKRLRVLADYHVLRHDPSRLRGWLFVARAAVSAMKTAAKRLFRWIWSDLLESRLLHSHADRREYRRMRPRNARVLIEFHAGRTIEAPIVDINEDALLVHCPERLPQGPRPLRLRIEVRFQRNLRPSSARIRIARCSGRVSQMRTAAGGWRCVIRYEPMTEWSRYLVHQYVLGGSLANPFRPLSKRSRERKNRCPAAAATMVEPPRSQVRECDLKSRPLRKTRASAGSAGRLGLSR